MKLVSYLSDGHDQLALLVDGFLYNMDNLHPELPGSIGMFLTYWEETCPQAAAVEKAIKEKRFLQNRGIPYEEVQMLSPVVFPNALRDAYAFRRHIETLQKNKGEAMLPGFDQSPVFRFSNHHSVQGAGDIRCMPDHLAQLDFELEAAVVICRHGRNIRAEHADKYIGGLMIMNNLSARALQGEEMLPAPAKGMDFATALGPALVTLDELEQFEIPPKENHIGKSWNMPMKCLVNGIAVSSGNLGDMDWTFAEIIERASYGVDLVPGDVIGSGTVGTGCFLELNSTGRRNDPDYTEQWLKEGDTIALEVTGLGLLRNNIVAEEDDWSILRQKKNRDGLG
ncbi:MAG: fumarylacetoacetate hydrolase [Sphingobacteriales bacterium 44-15]|nr:MAG: fumarylacetoacetate hydrolase [Sphingobacteriales bacterium 44-15]